MLTESPPFSFCAELLAFYQLASDSGETLQLLPICEEGTTHTVVHRMTDAVIGQETIFEGLLVPDLIVIEELSRLVNAFATVRGLIERTFEESTLIIELHPLFE
jgi:hypothetical protein